MKATKQRNNQYKLRATTLSEVVIVILLSSIVILIVFDGMTLIERYLKRGINNMQSENQTAMAYTTIKELCSRADQANLVDKHTIELLSSAEVFARITLSDSMLINRLNERCDTLMYSIHEIGYDSSGFVKIKYNQDTLFFALRTNGETFVEKAQNKYTYEEQQD